MGGKKKTKSLTLLEQFERDGKRITWNNLGETAKLLYDTPEDAHEILVNYSNNLRKAHQGTAPIVEFIDTKLRKSKKKISVRSIINENLKELCPYVEKKYSNVKDKKFRDEVIKLIGMRYYRAKQKES
tara:strand:- start:160 stop:543 length:384 start_codon:yes stop_codon:yes gene_type:complete